MKPVIYCIEEYEYFNPFGHLADKHDYIKFLVIFSCREGTVQFDESLSDLVKACEKHDPQLYHYLQNLLADMEEFYSSNTRLIKGLEQDGFDISRLLHVYYDHADLEHFANWIRLHGKNQERRTREEIQASWTRDDGLLFFGEFLHMRKEVATRVYEAMKEVLLGYLPTINLLETQEVRKINDQLNGYAIQMVEMAVSKWEKLDIAESWRVADDEDEEEHDHYDYDNRYDDYDDGEATLSTLKGSRRLWLKYRKENPVKGCEDNPIFCVEIVELAEEWETRGWNHVRVWYKLTCAEGEWYNDVDFEQLMMEALLFFPDMYEDALKFYNSSNSPRPRDPAMLHGLQRKGYDLTPVLASYVADRLNFLPELREEMRWKKRNPDYENSYVDQKEWEEEERDPVHVAEFQTTNLLRDDLVNVGMSVILRLMPEFHIRVPKYYLFYMEDYSHKVMIDPINDFGPELNKAFELKREMKR